ncbi:hypothetical protein Tco_1414596 [Tanacetum coccineum]
MSNGSVSASKCPLPHSVNEIKAMIQKHIKEDIVRQLTIMNLVVEFENESIAKDDMRKAYEECNDIPEEKRALIEFYLKEESGKDYEMHNALFRKAANIWEALGGNTRDLDTIWEETGQDLCNLFMT